MPDLFISYAREDRDTAQAVAAGLRAQGVGVWWDRELQGGGDYALEIERRLKAAPLALVLWSPASVQSEFVRDESARARDAQKLLPVRIADVALPLGFGTLHTLDLLDWDGSADDDAFLALLAQVRARLVPRLEGAGADATPPPPFDAGEDTLTRRRQRRQLVTGLLAAGVAGVGAAGGWAWWHGERSKAQSEARDRLDAAIKDQFATPPQLESAQSAYSEALSLDPTLARAHYFLGHLYAQLMLRGAPPPSGPLLVALRSDAHDHFQAAIALADAEPRRLDGSQRVIAGQQLALLNQVDEAPPLTRDAEAVGTGAAIGSGAVPGRAPAGSAATEDRPPPAADKTATLPRVAAAAGEKQFARDRAIGLFNSDRDARLDANTALSLDPALAAEALPSAVAQAAAALKRDPQAETTRLGLATTLSLLGRASPSTLRTHEAAIQALLDALAGAPDPTLKDATARLGDVLARSQRSRPVAYLQIANERQRGVAQALARRLTAAGYLTPGIENTGEARAPSKPSLRSQGGSDPALARWCQQALSDAAGEPAELAVLRNARPSTDTYEFWFDKALCAPGGRTAPGCASS